MAKGKKADDSNVRGTKSRNYIDKVLKSKNAGGASGLTADNFLRIWKHYDKDGNKFLERGEIDQFLKDLLASTALGLGDLHITDEEANGLRDTFLAEFDENKDGRISIRELSAILSPDESFFLLFRLDNGTPQSAVDYMNVWKKYDKDYSGYIELNELKMFLRDIITSVNHGEAPDEQKLNDYTNDVMEIFDLNKDGKLGLSELSRMLPAEENFVQQVVDKNLHLHKITQNDVQQILSTYDKNGNGYLESNEMSKLVRDIMNKTQTRFYTPNDLYELEQALRKGSDLNQDGRISTKELAVIIFAIGQSEESHAAEGGQDPTIDDAKRVYRGRQGQHISSYVPV